MGELDVGGDSNFFIDGHMYDWEFIPSFGFLREEYCVKDFKGLI